jgi:hypothetical protein
MSAPTATLPVIEALVLGALGFAIIPAATGRPPYHPLMLLKLYIYGNTALYARLAPVAEHGNAHGKPAQYPAKHQDFLQMGNKGGQTQPTRLLLQNVAGDSTPR